MKVRYRLLIAIGLTMLTTGIGVYIVSSRPMLARFASIESQRSKEDVQRVEQTLRQMMDELHAKSIDWSNWNDTYGYMKDHNAAYIEANMSEKGFVDLKVDMCMLLDQAGKNIYSLSVSQPDKRPKLIAQDILRQLTAKGTLGTVESGGPGLSGLVVDRGRPVIVSMRPILTSDGAGPRRGWFVFARYLGAPILARLREITGQDVSIVTASPDQRLSPEDASTVASLSGSGVTLRMIDDNHLVGCSLLTDIHGTPAILIKTKLPRAVSYQGKAVVREMGYQLLGIGAAFAIVIILVIERFALSRLYLLSRQVEQIDDLFIGTRVDLPGADELSSLASRINGMLSKVQTGAELLRASEERLRAKNEELEVTVIERTYESLHDSLTGLPNRSLFMDRVQSALTAPERRGTGTAALFIDLDNFKLVNDSLGHDMGDELLKAVAHRLTHTVRPGDTVARLGGDEFTLLLQGLDSDAQAVEVAERILSSLRRPISLGSRETYAYASVGVAYTSGDTPVEAEELLKRADTAMYRAKGEGKAHYVVYDETMCSNADDELEIATSLRKALDSGEIFVNYQPLINLKGETLVGAEALARWKHPERGLVPPNQFIPIAESIGLIVPIGYWIMEQACIKAKAWSEEYDMPDFVMSVNLSGKQLLRDDVVAQVLGVLERTALKPSCLQIEITESILVGGREDVIKSLQSLKELGVRLALDDFGTGYSSLATLQALPIDTLKIDRAFVDTLESGGGMAIIEAVLSLANTLELSVIGEGIENRHQEHVLKALGCWAAQGYLYDKPLSEVDFESRLIAATAGLEMAESHLGKLGRAA